jgi:NADPH:quinone reductase-like Zn-dependent oxidoreductase
MFKVTGKPFLARLMMGSLLKPRAWIPGGEIAGHVVAVGTRVRAFKPGDEVYGQGGGTLAEFAVATEEIVVRKPANLTFEEAASVPMVGLVAIQALRDQGKVRAGQKVLIIGAGGGIGSFAVQVAKAFGAEVTGVCSTGKVDLVRSLGADHVVDYTREDLGGGSDRYDFILDNVSDRSLRSLRGMLTRKGVLVMNGGEFGHHWVGPMGRFMRGALISRFGRGRITNFLSRANRADLLELTALLESGKVKPVVDRTFSLADTPAAVAEVAGGHPRGKLVVTVSR